MDDLEKNEEARTETPVPEQALPQDALRMASSSPSSSLSSEKSTSSSKQKKAPVKKQTVITLKKGTTALPKKNVLLTKKTTSLRKSVSPSLLSKPSQNPSVSEQQTAVHPSQIPQDQKESSDLFLRHKIVLLVAIAALLFFTQLQMNTVIALLDVSVPLQVNSDSVSVLSFEGSDYDVSDVDVTTITSTAQGIAGLFPVDEITSTEDAIVTMIPSGIPEYGEAMGVSFDDPVVSMEKLAGAYSALKQMAKEDTDVWDRYLSLAAAPRGISCEFCCGVGAQGVDSSGNLRCGCAHNPAVQSVTLWLMLNTDYSDAEILREVYQWKSLWFPKNMVGLALDIAGGDTSVLEDLPGMVGGC